MSLVIFLLAFVSVVAGNPLYLSWREDFLTDDLSSATGSNTPLEGKEWAVNDVLMRLKDEEIQKGRETSVYPPNMHFFHAKPFIDQSKVFEIIKLMPKGAVLHIHDTAIANINWLIKNATYRPYCYMCSTRDRGTLLFQFAEDQPTDNSTCEWKLVATERETSGNVDEFDKMLYDTISLVVDEPHTKYRTQHEVWTYFNDYFATVDGLVFYADVFEDYYRQGLKEFNDDGVQFMEVRALLQPIYELNGTRHDSEYTLQRYEDANRDFLETYQDSMGSKIIFTSLRILDKPTIESVVNTAIQLRQKYPHFMVGFDLVAQEDAGRPLVFYLDELLIPSDRGEELPYYFHAGETNWQGVETDENLIDALMLNSSRLGHANAAIKHPSVLKKIKDRNIPIEVNPISSQVMKHFDDIRNMPAAYFIAEGYPVVISSDDPVVWGASPISHDYYEVFMGVASARSDLRLLKQLTVDSIRYSALAGSEEQQCMDLWAEKWQIFLDKVLDMYNITDWERYVPTPGPTTPPIQPVTTGGASMQINDVNIVRLFTVFTLLVMMIAC
ncbi:adenosine deaminase 2-like [Ptychodera flava]|uniref:adenosine deaminase 2-like n=1 Tax=Ptychodera flava TaxID=63121 RepID=UPI00396A217F